MQKQNIKTTTNPRRFGVEIEYNSFDKLNRSVGDHNLPAGIYFFAHQISKTINDVVEVNKWHYTNNNNHWVLKPDASCGLEVCSPPLRGEQGLKRLSKVIESLNSIKYISADKRCSFHLHVEISDFTPNEIVALFKAWVSYELFFYFLTNPFRWLNQYCQPIGFSIPYLQNSKISYSDVISCLGEYKYYSINLYHYKKAERKTIEFRIMGNDACQNPDDALAWCKLILQFVDCCKNDFVNLNKQNIKYQSMLSAIYFLKITKGFDDTSLILWITERISQLVDNKEIFDSFPSKRYIWKELISVMQGDFKETINHLEGILT